MEIAVLIIVICVIVIGALIWEIKDLKSELDFAETRLGSINFSLGMERSQKDFQIYALQSQVRRLEKLLEIQMKRKSNNFSLSKDVIDAVHYAMKKSHPDNGGNAEDFIRFKKVYGEVSRKES